MNININKTLLVLLFLTLAMPAISVAVDIKTTLTNKDLDKKKQSESNKYLTAKQAYEVVIKNPSEVLFIDVRTPSEIEFVGWTPLVDAVIPYMDNDFDEWDEKNSRYTKVINGDFPIVFEDLVAAKGINKNSPIIFICRAGTRSSRAASLATKLGYTQAYTVIDGFEGDKEKTGPNKGHRTVNGWKNSQLPWSYEVDGLRILVDQ
ncbi:MAG: rhodanese-like domain-containing protein [Cycloclasticus sp.]|nr:rhodanese-like domain-containing protein [Cycloclasticus sp.]